MNTSSFVRAAIACASCASFLVGCGNAAPAQPNDIAIAPSCNAGASSVGGASSTASGGSSSSVVPAVGAGGGGLSGSSGYTPPGGPVSGGGAPASGGAGGAAAAGAPSWKQIWSDEFDAPDGTPVDATKWTHELGGTGWGNQELEAYTDSTVNSQQIGGNLQISATAEGAAQQTCWYGACQYTSARLITSGHFTTKYGRIEARIKVPAGKGIWPAFWMLGDNISVVSWPTCGELDIMETIGSDPKTLHGSMHGPGYSGASPLTASTTLPNGANLSDDFHLYAIEWEPDVVRFYLDTTLYETRTPADMPDGGVWVYDRPFFIILNVAVGGQWPGSPDATTPFPAQMLVDYVRAYSAE